MSRCRCSPTGTAMRCTCSSATARCSAGTRRSSRRRPHPGSRPRCARRMGRAATGAALAAGYENAGTVEFLLDQDGRLLLHRDEHAAAGRASGDRGDHRPRSGRVAAARSPPASRCRCARRRSLPRAMPSRRGSMPRTRPRASCPRSAGCAPCACRRAWRRARRHRRRAGRRGHALLRPDDRQDHRPRRRPDGGAGAAGGGARRDAGRGRRRPISASCAPLPRSPGLPGDADRYRLARPRGHARPWPPSRRPTPTTLLLAALATVALSLARPGPPPVPGTDWTSPWHRLRRLAAQPAAARAGAAARRRGAARRHRRGHGRAVHRPARRATSCTRAAASPTAGLGRERRPAAQLPGRDRRPHADAHAGRPAPRAGPGGRPLRRARRGGGPRACSPHPCRAR